MGDLTNDFSINEMECHCCGICNVNRPFIDKLQTARTSAGVKFVIRSGCRCPSRNAVVGGKPSSDHLTTDTTQCAGTDIACNNSDARFRIVKALLDAGFRRIGVYESFIHVGMSEDNPQDVMWR